MNAPHRRWLGPFATKEEALEVAQRNYPALPVTDKFDRHFAVPEERLTEFLSFLHERIAMESPA